MKRILVCSLVALFCLGLAPVLAGGLAPSPIGTPYVAASSPVAKSTSLAPFIHVRNSTVLMLATGIGYVDTVLTIDSTTPTGSYTNTTEVNDSAVASSGWYGISVYGVSQIVINNTECLNLWVYDSSQVTLTNSTCLSILTYNSSRVTINNNSLVYTYYAYDNSEISITNSTVSLFLFNNSRVQASESQITANLQQNSYLNADNSNLNLSASGFSTGLITNSNISGYLNSLDAANVTVVNSMIGVSPWYGFVCTGGTLTINGSTPPDLTNCRSTINLTSSSYLTPTLVSISSLDSSTVNIINNNTDFQVYSHAGSLVNIENTTAFSYEITCYDHSEITLRNITTTTWATIVLYDQSNANITNTTNLLLYTYDQSTAVVKYLNLSGSSTCTVLSCDLSVVDIINVTKTGGASVNLASLDLSVMTIYNSTVTGVGYAVKSTGDMWLTNNVLGGSCINTTKWYSSTIGTVDLSSIAIVDADTATIENSSDTGWLYLHENANLNIHNSSLIEVYMYDSSTLSGTNITLGMFSNLRVCDQSSASLSNITSAMMSSIFVRDSATLTCTGNASAPSSLFSVSAQSNYPNMANVIINNCTVTGVTGSTWIPQAPALLPILPLILIIFNNYIQSQLSTNTLLLIGGGLAAIIAAIVGITFWKRRP